MYVVIDLYYYFLINCNFIKKKKKNIRDNLPYREPRRQGEDYPYWKTKKIKSIKKILRHGGQDNYRHVWPNKMQKTQKKDCNPKFPLLFREHRFLEEDCLDEFSWKPRRNTHLIFSLRTQSHPCWLFLPLPLSSFSPYEASSSHRFQQDHNQLPLP